VWHKSSALLRPDHACIVRGSFDSATALAGTELTLFRRTGAWRRFDVTVRQRCYAVEEVGQCLEQAGFSEIRLWNASELGMQGDLAVGRVFFRAQRGQAPASPGAS
jgi:hypothetical protein